MQPLLSPRGLVPYRFLGYLILGLGSYNQNVGYPRKGVWYEPTGLVVQYVSRASGIRRFKCR